VYSNQAKIFINILLPLLEHRGESSKVFKLLKEWDCCYGFESKGAPLFELFYDALRVEVFGRSGAEEKDLGAGLIKHLSEQAGVFIDFYQNFDHVILNPNSVWYENNTQEEAFLSAFDAAKKADKGASRKHINTITFTNMLFQGKLPGFMGFDSKKVSLMGGRATPH
jgi:penicillin amidase